MGIKIWRGYGGGFHRGDWNWDTSGFVKNFGSGASVDLGDGLVGINITNNKFVGGEEITIAGTTNFDGPIELDDSTTSSQIVFLATYVYEIFAGTETATSEVTESNWLDEAGDNTTLPLGGDVIYFDSRAYSDPAGGYQGVTTGPSGVYNYGLIWVKKEFDGDGGDASNYIRGGFTDIIFEGSGAFWISLSEEFGGDITCDRVVSSASKGTGELNIKSDVNSAANTCKYAAIAALSGKLNIADDTAFSLIEIAGSQAVVSIGINCVIVKGGPTPAAYNVYDGSTTCDSPLGAVAQANGAFIWGTEGATVTSGVNCESLTRYGDGKFKWQPASDTSIIKEHIGYAGQFDARGTVNSFTKKQIGSGAGEQWEIFGGKVYLDSQKQNIKLAANSVVIRYGGFIEMPSGEQIGW